MPTVINPRSGLPYVITLIVGLLLGWTLTSSRSPTLSANGGDRWDESVLTTGPAFIKYSEGSKIQVAQDAIYFLDYRAGKLLGTVPMMTQQLGTSRFINTFAERDLVADFKIDLDTAARPHFLMTTGSMGSTSGNSYGDGWAPLFVFETTTRQVAVYKIEQQMLGTSSKVKFDLLELRPFTSRPPALR